MRFTGFVGPSYTLPSVNVDCQRCVNLYPEMIESGNAKNGEIASLLWTPGLTALATLGAGPLRGTYTASNGQLFVVSGNKLYRVSSSWSGTEVGTLSTSTGPVSMADSGKNLALVDGSTSGLLYSFTTNTSAAIAFPDEINFKPFAGCDQVSHQDGYFIFNHAGTGDFFISGLATSIVADDSTIDPLDFKSAEGSPDRLVAHVSNNRDLWMFGEQTTEVYFNSGADFPFDRIQGAFIEVGCAARFSVAKGNNTVFWVGKDEHGACIVYRAQGYQPQRISTHALEHAIRTYGDVSTTRAWCYQENGHFFYVLNFPNASTTWVYDATTGLWHERAYNNQGLLERHRADCHAYAYATHVVGDYETGKLYALSSSVYSDDGVEIVRRRVAPHISSNGNRIFYHKFQLDIETGTGLDGIQQGTDPQAMLQFSDDGGHTWSNEKWTSFGKIGQRKLRAEWRRLGSSRDRVFRVTISDPVKVVILGAELITEVGGS